MHNNIDRRDRYVVNANISLFIITVICDIIAKFIDVNINRIAIININCFNKNIEKSLIFVQSMN